MELLVQINEDCSHSPKKEFIKDLNVAFAEGDINFIKQHVSEDIEWNFVGSWVKSGKEVFEELERVKDSRVERLYLDCIIVYENRASCNGIIFMQNGNDYHFCDVFELNMADDKMVKKITSYMIQTNSEN